MPFFISLPNMCVHLWVCSWMCVTPPHPLILSGTDSWHVCWVRTNNSFQVFDQSSTTNIRIPQANTYTRGHPVEHTEWFCVLITTQTASVNKKKVLQFTSWNSECCKCSLQSAHVLHWFNYVTFHTFLCLCVTKKSVCWITNKQLAHWSQPAASRRKAQTEKLPALW